MKRIKKIMSFIFVMVLVCGCVWTINAQDNDPVISVNEDDTHTYSVYQVFTGDYHQSKLSNMKWGKNGKEQEGTSVSENDLNKLLEIDDSNEQKKLSVIKNDVNLDSEAFGTVSKDKTLSVPNGYYVIKDNGQAGNGDSYSLYVAKVVGEDIVIQPKKSLTRFEKKVKDTNDSTGDVSEWQDSADYDIGDKVPFKLEAQLSNNYSDYSSYTLVFHDKEAQGLTFNPDSVKVYVDNDEIVSSFYSVKTSDMTDGCTFEVAISDLKKTTAKNGSYVHVEYTSTLNDKAEIGSKGNENIAYLAYSNNPNDGRSIGTTVEDKVKVFTYQLVVNKYANDVSPGNELSGAMFTLTKKIKNGTDKIIECVKKDPNVFTFTGLDDGEYTLTETVTPKGYNTMNPITFTIGATHDVEAVDPTLKELTGNTESGSITFTSDGGVLTTNVVNKSGSALPSTGGMGTSIFYTVGGICILAAGVIFLLKKKSA